jgi:hypothetical protein
MLENSFYRFGPVLMCLVLMGVMFGAEELGFRLMGRSLSDRTNVDKGDLALVLGAILTLLALLLGFTYAMSQSRFETRRELVIEEANAIGTAYLRATTFPGPRSSEIQELLRRYAALRAEIARTTADSPENIHEADRRSKELHDLLWSHAAALARENPTPVVSIFLQALNEMIDLHTKRLAAFRNRVPLSIYLVLFIVWVITLWLVGYYFGQRRKNARILTALVVLIVASVMWLIMDLDDPVRGVIRAPQDSLTDLVKDLNQAPRVK